MILRILFGVSFILFKDHGLKTMLFARGAWEGPMGGGGVKNVVFVCERKKKRIKIFGHKTG